MVDDADGLDVAVGIRLGFQMLHDPLASGCADGGGGSGAAAAAAAAAAADIGNCRDSGRPIA